MQIYGIYLELGGGGGGGEGEWAELFTWLENDIPVTIIYGVKYFLFCLFVCLVGWLFGWLVGLWVGWLVGWLVGYLLYITK